MRALAAVAGAVVVASLAACGGHGGAHPKVVSARVESAWHGKLARWFSWQSGRGTFRRCRATLTLDVGPAPSDSTRLLERSVLDFCDLAERWQTDEAKAFTTRDARLYWRARRELAAVDRAVETVGDSIDAFRPGLGSIELAAETGVRDDSRIEPTFGKVATAIAGTRVTVRCWSEADWRWREREVSALTGVRDDISGLALFGERAAELSPTVCGTLSRFVYGGRRGSIVRLARAAAVLAHEATHLSGRPIEDEAVTECYAVQRLAETARRLGASRSYARNLADVYWRVVYPNDPPRYRSGECRRGGSLDLGLGDGPW